MKILTEYRKNGFDFKQVARLGNVMLAHGIGEVKTLARHLRSSSFRVMMAESWGATTTRLLSIHPVTSNGA